MRWVGGLFGRPFGRVIHLSVSGPGADGIRNVMVVCNEQRRMPSKKESRLGARRMANVELGGATA